MALEIALSDARSVTRANERRAADIRPVLSLIVAVDTVHEGVRRSLADMMDAVESERVEIIAASREELPDAPPGVRVVVLDSPSRGDRYDRAVEHASGDLLAFTDYRIRLPRNWAASVRTVFNDHSIAVAGGPVVPRSRWRGERISALIMDRHFGATPSGHISRLERARPVSEVAGSNLIIRRELFFAVGGFQSPSVGGEAVRLCYKVRTLLDRRVLYEPALAVSATAPRFPGSFLADIAAYGRARGDLARRYREVAPLIPYGLPTLFVLLILAELALLPFHPWKASIIGGAILLLVYLVEAVSVLRGKARLSDRLVAAAALPLVPIAYGLAFVRGYLGRNLADVSPMRSRKRPLRVLIINWRDLAHPSAGGAETYMHEIGRRWAEQGMDVGWLCQRHSRSARIELIDGIRVHRVGGRFTLYPRVAITYLMHLRGRYDIIVDCENGIPFFTPLFSRVPKVLVVHHVHQHIFRERTRPPMRWLGLWLEGWVMPRVYRKAQVIAVSESTRADLIDLGFPEHQIEIVHNGVHLPDVPPQPTLRPTILYLGRLTRQKCIDVCLRAMPMVLRAYPDARLEIVGQGPDRNRLERLSWSLRLASSVRFHGYLMDGLRDAVAAQAWVAVCPSAFEGWGASAVEASARGLPVIASNVNGLRDSVRDGETGILVPHNDPVALAEALLELLGDRQRRGEMGAAGFHWASLHSWDNSAAQLRRILLRHANRGRRDLVGVAQPVALPAHEDAGELVSAG
jgi:glycosyltransferase involved in cell wall biosynthesis